MKIYKLYEQTLVENQVDKCVKLYGKELFGSMFGKERDTENEKDILFQIKRFTVMGFGKMLSKKFVENILKLRDCMSVYPDILQPEGIAYRGTKIKLGTLIKNKNKLNKSGEFQFAYKPKAIIQSWTSSYDVALEFANKHGGDNNELEDIMSHLNGLTSIEDKIDFLESETNLLDMNIPVVYSHDATPDSFLFKSKYFSSLSEIDSEDELLRIDNSPIKVNAIAYPNRAKELVSIIKLLTTTKSPPLEKQETKSKFYDPKMNMF